MKMILVHSYLDDTLYVINQWAVGLGFGVLEELSTTVL